MMAIPATHTLWVCQTGAEEAYRSILQNAKREQEADCQFLKFRELKFLDLDDRQNQDTNINQDVRKNRPKEEICTLDRTYEVLDVRIPEGIYGIAMKCGKKDLEDIYKLEFVFCSTQDDLHGQ